MYLPGECYKEVQAELSKLLSEGHITNVPVGHIWKFDLERSKKTLDFGVKFNFSKFRMEPVMHDFLARTENQKKR